MCYGGQERFWYKSPINNELITIAKFAKLAGLPVSTIRYYMKEGKIKPTAFTKSGYALFNKNQTQDVKRLINKD